MDQAGTYRYGSADDFFSAVRDASKEVERTRKALAKMKSAEGPKAQSYEPRVSSGSNRDVMRRTDDRMDYERRYRKRIEEDYRLIDMACDVIYGRQDQQCGGVGAMLGTAYADALWWRYCAAGSWPEVARGTGMSEKWCRDEGVPVALDTIDSYGLARMAEGLGLAEA